MKTGKQRVELDSTFDIDLLKTRWKVTVETEGAYSPVLCEGGISFDREAFEALPTDEERKKWVEEHVLRHVNAVAYALLSLVKGEGQEKLAQLAEVAASTPDEPGKVH